MECKNTSEAADNRRPSADTTDNLLLASTVEEEVTKVAYSDKLVEAKAEFDAKNRKLMEVMAKLKRLDSEESVDEKENQIDEGQIYGEIKNCSEESTKALLKYYDTHMERYKMFECPVAALTERSNGTQSMD